VGDDQCRRMFRPREASSEGAILANCSRFCISSWFKCSIDPAARHRRVLSGCLNRDDNSLQNNDTLSQPFAISHRTDDLVSRLAERRCDKRCARSVGKCLICFPRSNSWCRTVRFSAQSATAPSSNF
jgi:hypothetical protein